jgi:hypothetical protein
VIYGAAEAAPLQSEAKLHRYEAKLHRYRWLMAPLY